MISLVTPNQGVDRFYFWLDTMYGPVDGTGQFSEGTIQFPSEAERIDQSRGIYHENNVIHQKVDGVLRKDPFRSVISLAPTADMPNRQKITVKRYDGAIIDVYATYGRATHNTVSRYHFMSGSYHRYAVRAFEQDPNDPTKWTIWRVESAANAPTQAYTLYRYTLKYVEARSPYDGAMVYFMSQQFGTWKVYGPNLWATDITVAQVKSYFYQSGSQPYAETGPNASAISWYPAYATGITSPSADKTRIDRRIANIIWNGYQNFPIEDVNYGDLAMEASEQTNAISVNLMAFFRDLRKPSEMIPKLRNLASWDTLANNYLTVEYGLLPTVSDLKEIIGAFKKASAYVDRNGYQTCTAKSIVTQNIDGNVYTREQRIKLAMDNEDVDFLTLIQKLESMGTLPTFENVWDLIPYSFVIDWFLDVGGFLERIDTRLRLIRLKIRYATMSRKAVISNNFSWTPSFPYSGSITWVHYRRWVSDQCPVPPLSLQTTFQDFNHWLESGALLKQRIKN